MSPNTSHTDAFSENKKETKVFHLTSKQVDEVAQSRTKTQSDLANRQSKRQIRRRKTRRINSAEVRSRNNSPFAPKKLSSVVTKPKSVTPPPSVERTECSDHRCATSAPSPLGLEVFRKQRYWSLVPALQNFFFFCLKLCRGGFRGRRIQK